MGCASIGSVQFRKVIPLPSNVVNTCVDKYPIIVVQKLKEKFESFCDGNKDGMTLPGFLKMYTPSQLSQPIAKRLFRYFNDDSEDNLRFKNFMLKYAIITKCDAKIFFQILFMLYKSDFDSKALTEVQLAYFIKMQQPFLEQKLEGLIFPVMLDNFVSCLEKAKFKTSQSQKKFILTNEKDIPFQAINKELIECDFNDLNQGKEYYVLSTSWFYRWSFYYQEISHHSDISHFKSTKLVQDQKLDRYVSRKKSKRRQAAIHQANSETILDNCLIAQPESIEFTDIEGQYAGELKENLKTSTQCKIVTDNLWKMLISLHPSEQIFKRTALNNDTLEYYPKFVYFLSTDENGIIVPKSQIIQQASVQSTISALNQATKPSFYFFKNFGEIEWKEESSNKMLGQCSLSPRFFIVQTSNRQKFKQNYRREEVKRQNLTVGDTVFAYFAYEKEICEGVVVRIGQNDRLKIHFKKFSFRYEAEFAREELSVGEVEANPSQKKRRAESIVKGIPNIGNTCFMNSIVQCLVATPVLQNYLTDEQFSSKDRPITFQLANLAKSLLKLEKVQIYDFKKKIDVVLPAFSGYDQQDAQQFLNLLLDKISQELKDKPTIIDSLFGGKISSKLSCMGCHKTKNVEENMYILSLPIPEPEFNCFTLVIVPLTSSTMKKIILRLEKNATINDYIEAFEERTRKNRKDFIFCEYNYASLKKLRNQFITPAYANKKIMQKIIKSRDLGIAPSIPLQAFQKLPQRFYNNIRHAKTTKQQDFKDFRVTGISQTYWTICKTNPDKTFIEYVNQSNQIEKMKIKANDELEFAVLGQKSSELSFKKMILRKYNANLNRMDSFGIQFLVGIPKWASYEDVMQISEEFLVNLKNKDVKSSKSNTKDYIIRLIDPVKLKCIFCLTENKAANLNENELGECCSSFKKELPLPWTVKNKSYWIYVDWIDFSGCNAMFCSYIEMDQTSKEAENKKNEEKVMLEECLQLQQKPEKVEMKCESCKYEFQTLENIISSMPNILVLHMKEFRYTSEGHLIKLDIRLKWQEFIDSSLFSHNQQGKIYQLFAFVRHTGSSQSGHYTCMTKRKHPLENKKVWVNFDDDITDIVKQELKNIDDAYLLFYKKVDMPTSAFLNYTTFKEFGSGMLSK